MTGPPPPPSPAPSRTGAVSPPKPGRRLLAAGLLAGVAVAVSWGLLAARVLHPGLETSHKDQRHYLASAASLVESGRLALPAYRVEDGAVVEEPLTSFPPVTSWLLAALLALGVPLDRAPTLLALAAWPLLLAALGALAWRLGGDPLAAAFAVAFGSITWPYLNVFTEVSSEILYLPLTVLAVLAFDRLLHRPEPGWGRLLLAAACTTLLLLVRYTGMFYYAAVLAWWVGSRLVQGRAPRLLRELPVLALPGLVFALWIGRNLALVGEPFGPVLMAGTLPSVDAGDVAASFATHASWLLLPAVRPGAVWRTAGVAGLVLVGGLALAGVALLWKGRRPGAWRVWQRVPRSPLVPFLVVYLAFLAVAPSFMRMQGMIERYMAVVLCLAQPYLAARFAAAPRRPALAFLGLLLVANAGAAVAFTLAASSGPAWGPHGAPDLAGEPAQQWERLLAGTPAWWVHRPPRLGDLRNHHPDVARLLDELGTETAVVSNVPELFSARPLLVAEEPVTVWLENGTCRPRDPTLVVVLDWDRWGVAGYGGDPPDPAALRARIEARCPAARRLELRHAVAYRLPSAGGAETASGGVP